MWAYLHSIVLSGGGDWASIVGVVFSIIGFVFTIHVVLRTKTIAEAAVTAAEETRNNIRRTDSVAELSAAITTLDEIKLLQRKNIWESLPHRYALLRKTLISVRIANASLRPNQMIVIQNAISMASSMEQLIERTLTQEEQLGQRIDVVRVNATVSQQIDALHELLAQVKELK